MTEPVIPDGIRALGPDVTERVQQLVLDAERRQAAEAAAAVDTALRIVPWPVRGVVKRVLLG